MNASSEFSSSEELFLPSKLKEVTKISCFKIVHQNIQSLKRKVDEIRVILSELNLSLHLIAFTETWANDDLLDGHSHIPGDDLFKRDRGCNGGGIVVYVKSNISANRREDLEIVGVEGLWIEISLPN